MLPPMCHQPIKAHGQGQRCTWWLSHVLQVLWINAVNLFSFARGVGIACCWIIFQLHIFWRKAQMQKMLPVVSVAVDESRQKMMCVWLCVCVQRIWSCQADFYLLMRLLTQHRTRATINLSNGHWPPLCSLNISHNCKMSCKKQFF